jgi:hypothetical protein
MSQKPGNEARQQLIDFNIEKIEQCYVQAKAKGMAHPVILVLDLRDVHGGEVGKYVMGENKRDTMLTEAAAKNMKPVVIVPMERDLILPLFSGVSPELAKALQKPLPPDCFLAVAFAVERRSTQNALLLTSIRARSSNTACSRPWAVSSILNRGGVLLRRFHPHVQSPPLSSAGQCHCGAESGRQRGDVVSLAAAPRLRRGAS